MNVWILGIFVFWEFFVFFSENPETRKRYFLDFRIFVFFFEFLDFFINKKNANVVFWGFGFLFFLMFELCFFLFQKFKKCMCGYWGFWMWGVLLFWISDCFNSGNSENMQTVYFGCLDFSIFWFFCFEDS